MAMIPVESGAPLPPPITVRLDETVRTYLRRRLQQHTHDSYAGVPLQKFPEDLRVYEQLLWESRANVVIEIGSAHGASALWFRDRLQTQSLYGRIWPDWRVITIDVDHGPTLEGLNKADPNWQERIRLVTGDVRATVTAERVRELISPSDRRFVVEDSAHISDTTRAALDAFADLVPVDGYFVVEDGVVDVEELRFPEYPRGVLPAVSAWLASPAGARFVRRRDLECYGVTCHPFGFLQRVAERENRPISEELPRRAGLAVDVSVVGDPDT